MSRVLAKRPNFHAYGWKRDLARGSRGHGVHMRWRLGKEWQNARVVVMQANKLKPGSVTTARKRGAKVTLRPTLTIAEVSVWRTHGIKVRAGTKGYVRLKIAWPGRMD